MDRPLAGRGAAAQLDRILGQSLSLPTRPAQRRGRTARRPRSPLASSPARRAWQLLRSQLERVLALAAPLLRRRRLRVVALALAVALALLSGGWLWLRHSSLVAVRRVQIVGLHGPQAGPIAAALQAAARHMSTLDVRPGVLRAAVAGFPAVREVRASTSFPHGLQIRVVEQPAVAVLSAAGVRTAVAANGVVLGPSLASGSLPTLSAGWAPRPGQRLAEAPLREALTVLGAVPAPLARFVQRAYTGPQGLTVVMRTGVQVYFGDADRPHAKWLALALVLSNERAAGASYVDVRVPERPAAGFAPGSTAASAGSGASGASTSEGAATPESTSASIAARLAAAVGREEASRSPSRSSAESGASGEQGASSEHGASGEQASPAQQAPSGTANSTQESGAGRAGTSGAEAQSGSSAEAAH